MANKKISNLTGATSVTDASVFPVVDSGATKKVTGLQIKTHARSGLSTVATSGSYTDLTNKPTLFDGNYISLTNKPTLFDGDYNSLLNQPVIPTKLSDLNQDELNLTGTAIIGANADVGFNLNVAGTTYSGIINAGNIIANDIELHGVQGIKFSDNTVQTTAYTGQGGGTSYDQSLNTTDSPAFSGLSVGGELNLYTVKQVRGSYVNCQPNVDTVIYTATGQWQHTIKLLVQVEGIEGGQGPWETQSCEIIVSRSFVNNKVAGSVYGLVYTSNAALATFTARWNNTTSRVEVVCRPESTISNVVAHAFATEISTAD